MVMELNIISESLIIPTKSSNQKGGKIWSTTHHN